MTILQKNRSLKPHYIYIREAGCPGKGYTHHNKTKGYKKGWGGG